MSPSAPVPHAQYPRHLNGAYAELYAISFVVGPSHRSQFIVSGTGWLAAQFTPCGQIGRSVQQCTSLIFPSAPDVMNSTVWCAPSDEWCWFPICVATLCFRAVSVIARASLTVYVSGFSQ